MANSGTPLDTKLARDTIDGLLARVKLAEARTEPGGYMGATSHPSKDIDDRTEEAKEGERSSENTSDIKEDVGKPSVDATPEGKPPGDQNSLQMQVGLSSKETGTDTTNETDSAKAGKDDPGSSHPARTDNDSLDGNKYASAGKVLELIKAAQADGTQLLARLAASLDARQKAAAAAPAAPAGKTTTAAAAPAAPAAPAAEASAELLKQAQDLAVVQAIQETVINAERMALQTADWLKQAEFGEEPVGSEEGAEGGSEGGSDGGSDGGAGGGPPAAGGGSPELGGGNEQLAQILQLLLAGGDHMGAEPAMGGMSGPDPADGMGGGMGEGMGGGNEEAMLQEAMSQAGVSPELVQAKAAEAAAKAARSVGGAHRPRFIPKTAQERQQLAGLVDYVRELCAN